MGEGKGEKKGNAMWVDGEGGAGEWRVVVEEGAGVWVGVAEETNFGPGWQLKGLLYGGPGDRVKGGLG